MCPPDQILEAIAPPIKTGPPETGLRYIEIDTFGDVDFVYRVLISISRIST